MNSYNSSNGAAQINNKDIPLLPEVTDLDHSNDVMDLEYTGSKHLSIVQIKNDKYKKIVRKVLSALHENKNTASSDFTSGGRMIKKKTPKRSFVVSSDTDQSCVSMHRGTVMFKKTKDDSASSSKKAPTVLKCPVENGELC